MVLHSLVTDTRYAELLYNPHKLLGLHEKSGKKVVRFFRPDAPFFFFQLFGETIEAPCIDKRGFFECEVPLHTTHFDYKIYHSNGLLSYDPYAFLPTFCEKDAHFFNAGCHYKLHKKMGGRLKIHQGIYGASFVVWAPNADSVSLIGDFNHFDGRQNPMRSLGASGVWELFIPGLQKGEKYKFEIQTKTGKTLLKTDPYALQFEYRPKTASQLADVDSYRWDDDLWMKKRKDKNLNRPINIYEVHLGSWKKKEGSFYTYRQLAHDLATYCNEMGYTDVELLPITEHPFDESWGYQVTGFFAPTSRYGSVSDFQYFVDYMHQHDIGVIVDWVPGHFPKDDFALSRYDGTALYEHEDPRQGEHPHWSTYIFNFGRREVQNFLIASALYWLDMFHVDALRVDAVASMLYLDYGREGNEWIPNHHGGRENLDAIELLKHVNSIIHTHYPGVLTIAEESTSFPKVSAPVAWGGLGFDLKWNMGWMNDTLRYFSKDPIYRSFHQNELTFGMMYAFSENFVLVLSHDEVVHGKRSLLSKMPGDLWQKFANVRLLLSYMMTFPGKKLLFMGGEIGQWNEWDVRREVEWMLLDYPFHNGLQRMVKELNQFYLHERALWENDFSHEGFEWVDFSDQRNSIISFLRRSKDSILFCLCNFTPEYHERYRVPLKNVAHIETLFSSDASQYGGSGKTEQGISVISSQEVEVEVAPLSCQIHRVAFLEFSIF